MTRVTFLFVARGLQGFGASIMFLLTLPATPEHGDVVASSAVATLNSLTDRPIASSALLPAQKELPLSR